MFATEKKQAKPKKEPQSGPAPAVEPSEASVQIALQLFADTSSAPVAAEAGAADGHSSNGATTGSQATAPYGVVVEDDVPLADGQIHRTDFLDKISAVIEQAADEELAPTGRTARDCPYLEHWIRFYRHQPAAKIERAIERYAAPTRINLAGLEAALVRRVRRAVQAWTRSGGREIQAPEGVSWLGSDDGVQGGGEVVQRKATGPATIRDSPSEIRGRLGAGRALDGHVRTRMEEGFGQSFSGVRLHTDPTAAGVARSLSARAFTVGHDVAFAAGQYRPGTLGGDLLIAHELAHVVQQRNPGAMAGDPEQAANRSAAAVLQGGEARPGSVAGLSLQRCSTEGSGYDPTQTEEYHEDPPTPEEMIAQHTTALGDLDEDGLGKTLALMAWYTPRHHDYIRRVFEALDWGDRDDVAAAMIANTQDSDLADIARTEEGRALLRYIVPELTEGWTWPGGDTYAALRALRALKAKVSADDAVKAELTDMEQAVGAAEAPGEQPVEVLSEAELRERLRLIDVHLDRFEQHWSDDTKVMEAVTAVRGRLAQAHPNVAAERPALSRSVQVAQQVLETCELILKNTDQQIHSLETELQRRGTEEANVQLLRFVRERFVEALGAAMGPEARLRYAKASAALQQLSISQVDIEVAVLEHRPELFGDVEPKITAMRQFATEIRTQLHALEAEALSIQQAAKAGEDVTARRAAGQRKLGELALSHRVLANWDVLIQVAEALESGFSFTEPYYFHDVDVDSLHARLSAMAQLARDGKLKELRKELQSYENDEEIKAYFKDVPSILHTSGIVVAIGVVIATALVTWGVGSVFAAPAAAGTGAAATGAATEVTAGTVAAGIGSTALNALLFTSVHRGLSEITGVGAKGSFFEDFLWNFGLFGVLRMASIGAQAYIEAKGLARLARPIQQATAFGVLEGYGLFRFRVEEGRLPSAGEIGSMTLQNLVVFAAIMGVHKAVNRFSPLGRFQARWGSRFEAIRLDQQALERDAQKAIAENRTSDFESELQQRGKALEARMKSLVDEVIAEGNLTALQTQLEGILGMEASQAALTESMGMLPEVELRRAGTQSEFSYRHGETPRLMDGLRGLGLRGVEASAAEGESRVVQAQTADGQALYFVERAAEPAGGGGPSNAVPQGPPAERNAVRLEAAKEDLQRRAIPWSRVPTDLQGLERARPRSQSNERTIAETSRQIGRLETWIGEQSETPWQTGREVKVDVPVDKAQAEVARLPRGDLRDHLQGNARAAVVYGALKETSPATAAARMQTMWEAWNQAGQEGSFADFAESALVESAVAELRTAGDGPLADLLESDPRVQNAFGRMGYDVGRLRAVQLYHEHGYTPGSGRSLSFAEYLQHQVGSLQGEGRSWAERRGRLAVPIPADGFEPLRTRLTDLTDAGTLSETDAKIVWRWNEMIQALINDSAARIPGSAGGGTRAEAVLNYLLEGVGKDFSESSYRNFRHRIRGLIVDDIIFLRGGADTSSSPATHDGTPIRAWGEQLTQLETWEGRAPAGDSATIGALWTAYAEARFDLGLPADSSVAAIETIPGRNLRMPDGRMGDAAVKFGGGESRLAPSKGEWAVDYKGGSNPYDADQSANYSANMNANQGRFIMGGRGYRGLIYIFQNSAAAEAAAESMNSRGLHANLKVGYFGAAGEVVWVR